MKYITDKPKVAILIAARMKSTRLPRKCMLPIEDQPLICHLIDRMKASKEASVVVLCTSTNPDDQILVEQAIQKNILYVKGSEDDVMDRFLKAVELVNADIIVRVTGDNPLTCPEYIDQAILHHIETKADYTSTIELPQGTKGEVISVSALRKVHELAEEPNNSEYMTLYFTKNPTFFKIGKGQVKSDMKRPQYRLTVDYPEDLVLIKEIYKRLYKSGLIVSLKEVIKLLDQNHDLAMINSNVKSKDIGEINVQLKCQK